MAVRMTNDQIVTAWKNVDCREQLTAAERASLPAHPAGESVLSEFDLEARWPARRHRSSAASVARSLPVRETRNGRHEPPVVTT
jgi:mersacidin/lichenicidin family type 2 lantibiotic